LVVLSVTCLPVRRKEAGRRGEGEGRRQGGGGEERKQAGGGRGEFFNHYKNDLEARTLIAGKHGRHSIFNSNKQYIAGKHGRHSIFNSNKQYIAGKQEVRCRRRPPVRKEEEERKEEV